jgi:hypothetical protein
VFVLYIFNCDKIKFQFIIFWFGILILEFWEFSEFLKNKVWFWILILIYWSENHKWAGVERRCIGLLFNAVFIVRFSLNPRCSESNECLENICSKVEVSKNRKLTQKQKILAIKPRQIGRFYSVAIIQSILVHNMEWAVIVLTGHQII